MIKKLAALFALLFMAHLSMNADYAVIVHLAGDTKQAFMVEKRPVLTFEDEDLMVECEDVYVTIPRAEILNIDFGEESRIVATPADRENAVEILDNSTFRFRMTNPDAIRVFDTAGRAVPVTKTAEGKNTVLSIDSNAAGVYIITHNDKSFKITKK